MSFKEYSEYKNSEVQWIGNVPDHWEVTRLKNIFLIQKRIAGKVGLDVLSITNKGIKVKDIENGDGQLSSDYGKYQLVFKGDFAMNQMDLLTGYVDISDFDGVTSPDYRVFSVKRPELDDARYLLRLLQNAYHQKLFFPFGQGSAHLGRWRLPAEEFNDFLFPRPSCSEQRTIARFLDHETAKIDALIQEQERLIELLQEKRQAVISQAVTKGLDPDVPMKDSGVEWLGEVPAHWGIRKFFFGVKKVIDNRGRSPSYADSGIPILEAKQLSTESMGCAVNFEKFITERSYAEYIRDDVLPGDVLMVTVGSIGKVGIVGDDPQFVVLQNLVGFRVTDDVDPEFMGIYLKSAVAFMAMQATNKESILSSVKVSDFVRHKMPLPPLNEQRLISRWVKAELLKFESLQDNAEHLCEVLGERRSALISAAVTGKIDVRNWQPPADESAFDEEVRRTGLEATA